MVKLLVGIYNAIKMRIINPRFDFDEQFQRERAEYLQDMDFCDWFRYWFIVREIIGSQSSVVLDVGAGCGIVKNCLQPIVERYVTMDVSSALAPDILADVREFRPELKGSFDYIIIAEVLEHIPFAEVERVCGNLFAYLVPSGKILVTIPHQRYSFLFVIPTIEPYILTIPRRKTPIDSYHCWEIGDGEIKKGHIESIFKSVGFKIERYEKLLYVDFWTLVKH